MATLDAEAFREFERRGHDRAARAYCDFFEPVTAGTIETLLDTAAIRRGSRVVDVACGTGVVAAAVAARGAAVIGVDLSPEMVAVARTRHPGLEFREADAERLPFPEASREAVVCNFGVGHFARPELVAAEFVRTLVPGGRAALSWWDGPARTRINGVFLDAVAEVGVVGVAGVPVGPPPFRFSDDAELRALLTIAGLEHVTVRTLTWTHRVPSADAWWEGGLHSLVRASASVLAQPPDVQRRIRAAFDRLIERHRGDDGFVVPVSAKIAAGRKP
jgi:SAM-dependent methyltransferase